MHSKTTLIVTLAFASLALAGPQRLRRDDVSDSGVTAWTEFEDQECQESEFTADYSRDDVEELLEALKDDAEKEVIIPAGEERSNNRFFYCKAAGLIIGNHGDKEKKISLSSFSVSWANAFYSFRDWKLSVSNQDKLGEAVNELDCDKTQSMFLKMFSDDNDDTELLVWIQVGSTS